MTESIASLRAQLRQLQHSHAAGTLDAPTYASLKAPLERRLVDAVVADQDANGASPAAGPLAASTAAPVAIPAPAAGGRLWAAAIVSVAVVAGAGYWWTGTPGAIGQPPAAFTAVATPPAAAEPGAAVTREQIESMLARLVERLKDKPDDAEGWLMLGRSYMALDRQAEAVDAYQHALKLRPDDANLLADYADASAAVGGRGLEGEPMQLIEKALRIDPGNLKALALAGSAAFNRGDFAGAAVHWDKVVRLGPPQSQLVELARGGAAEARQRAGLPSTASAGASAPAVAANPSTAASAAVGGKVNGAVNGAVSGTVSLAPALKAQAAPGDTVFVFARAAEGGRMPLAILRRHVSDLPITFTLDDSLSMSPAALISSAGRVVVSARISKSGQATPQPGDLEGLSAPVAVGTSGVAVEIGTQVR